MGGGDFRRGLGTFSEAFCIIMSLSAIKWKEQSSITEFLSFLIACRSDVSKRSHLVVGEAAHMNAFLDLLFVFHKSRPFLP